MLLARIVVGVDRRPLLQRRQQGGILVKREAGREGVAPFEVGEPLKLAIRAGDSAVGLRSWLGRLGRLFGGLVDRGPEGVRNSRETANVWQMRSRVLDDLGDGFVGRQICGRGRSGQCQADYDDEEESEERLESSWGHL